MCLRASYLIAVAVILSAGVPARALELGWDADPYMGYDAMRQYYEEVGDKLRSLDGQSTADLIEQCAGILDVRRAAREGRPPPEWAEMSRAELLEQERRDWLSCGATIRRMGLDRDPDQLQVLEGFCGRSGVAHMRNRIRYGRARLDMAALLSVECQYAYINIEFGGMSIGGFLNVMRDRYIRDGALGMPAVDLSSSAFTIAMRRLRESPVNHRPEIFDAYVALVEDPDPRIRELAASRFIGRSKIPDLMIPAVLRFLSKDDVDDDARDRAVEGLRALGYEPVSGPEGIRAVPLDGAGPPMGPQGEVE